MNKDRVEYFYDKYSEGLMNVAESITGNVYDAEDVVQMCFEWLQRQREINAIEYTTLLKMCKYSAKSIKEYRYRFCTAPEVYEDPLNIVLHQEAVERIFDCVQKMKHTYREVMCMYIIEQLKPHEIARALNMKTDTVSKKVQRGKILLKKVLSKKGLM